MLQRRQLEKITNLASSKENGINLSQTLLCAVALGKKLSDYFSANIKAQQAFRGLRRYKFVKHTGGNNYALTPKGEKKLRNIFIDEIIIKTPEKWDGKWRLVMYDVPVRFKKAREALRWKIKDLGLYQFQKSVWIYPYPCEGELLLVADFFGVRKYIEILEVTKVLDDRSIKDHFFNN